MVIMTQTKKIVLCLMLGCFFLVQLYHTCTNSVHWPFSPMNLFSKLRGEDQRVYYFKLKDSADKEFLVHGKFVVPIEHFRAKGVLAQVYAQDESENTKSQFSRALINLLNEAPIIFSLNEVFPSIRPSVGHRFVSLHIELHHFHMNEFNFRKPLQPFLVEQIY
jgi:hypothetical protein